MVRFLSTGLLQVDTEGGALGTHGGFATSSSQVDALDILSGILTAGSVISACTSNGDGSTASTNIVNGQIPLLGLTLDASPAPNSTIAVSPTITVTLNEQSEVNVVGDETSVVVNAIHVTVNNDPVFGSGDIVIAQSSCSAQGPDVLKSPPVAVDDVASTPEDTPTTVPVLDNDSDPDGDELTVTDVTDPANGSVVVNGDGTITYTPDSGFSGEDTFTYTVCDPDGLCDTATVTVTVTAVNDPPVAVPRLPVTGRTLGPHCYSARSCCWRVDSS